MKAEPRIAPERIGAPITDARANVLILSVLGRASVPLSKAAIGAVIALENSAGIDLGLAENVLRGDLVVEMTDNRSSDILDVDRYLFTAKEAK